MASKKTSMFTLTERLTITSAADVQATIDLGSYVDVGDRQALQVHSVDFIFQGDAGNIPVVGSIAADSSILCQMTDLNRGAFVFADDRSLIASAALYKDTANGLFDEADMYPDNYGKGSDDGRFVVNDQLYLIARATTLTADREVNVTVRVNASIVNLSAKDFMAIAIQSTAADN